MENQKLLDSLKTIKRVCIANYYSDEGCAECPLFNIASGGGNCYITCWYPNQWQPYDLITGKAHKVGSMTDR